VLVPFGGYYDGEGLTVARHPDMAAALDFVEDDPPFTPGVLAGVLLNAVRFAQK